MDISFNLLLFRLAVQLAVFVNNTSHYILTAMRITRAWEGIACARIINVNKHERRVNHVASSCGGDRPSTHALASSPDPPSPGSVCGRPCRGRCGSRSHQRSCRAYAALVAPTPTSGINSFLSGGSLGLYLRLSRPFHPPRLPLLLANNRRFSWVSNYRRRPSDGSKQTAYFARRCTAPPSVTSTPTQACCRSPSMITCNKFRPDFLQPIQDDASCRSFCEQLKKQLSLSWKTLYLVTPIREATFSLYQT